MYTVLAVVELSQKEQQQQVCVVIITGEDLIVQYITHLIHAGGQSFDGYQNSWTVY